MSAESVSYQKHEWAAVVCGLSVSASADYPHLRASDLRTVRVRKCTATTSPRIDRVRNCTVITGIQSPARNTHVNEQSQSAEFSVTCKVQKSWSAGCFTASTLYSA